MSEQVRYIAACCWADFKWEFGLLEEIPDHAGIYLDDLNDRIEIVWSEDDAGNSTGGDHGGSAVSAAEGGGDEGSKEGREGAEGASRATDGVGEVVDLDAWRKRRYTKYAGDYEELKRRYYPEAPLWIDSRYWPGASRDYRRRNYFGYPD